VALTRAAAESGRLAVMVGATDALFKRIGPLLAHIGTDITHCGGPGAGQATKLINNMLLFQNVVALAEALTLARKAGLWPQRLFETLTTGSAGIELQGAPTRDACWSAQRAPGTAAGISRFSSKR